MHRFVGRCLVRIGTNVMTELAGITAEAAAPVTVTVEGRVDRLTVVPEGMLTP